MTRETFDRELQVLDTKILRLGSTVEEDILKAVGALNARDLRTSREMIDLDEWVNNQRIEIMMGCFTLIATQQPTGPDMRSLAAILEIAGELERIHDYVKGIGKISLKLGEESVSAAIAELLPRMGELASEMLQRALAAYAANDTALAKIIPAQDNEVDALYEQVSHALAITVTADRLTYQHANMLQWAVHNLERSADRVINICEWIIYKETGKYKELDSEYEAPVTLPA